MDKENKIRELTKKMNAREDEFNAEKGNFDVLLLNGKTLSALIMSSSKKVSTQGKYKEHLEEQIKKSEKKIKDLKNDDKFYRRDFIEGKPLTAQPSPFWSNIHLCSAICGVYSSELRLSAATKPRASSS